MGSKICSQLICILSAHFQLGFSSKLKYPSSARLGSENFQLGLARAGKFQLEPITTKNNFLGKMFSTNIIFFYSYRQKNKSQCRSMQTIQWPVCYTVFQRRKNLTHYKNSDQFQCRYLLEKTGSLWQDPTF